MGDASQDEPVLVRIDGPVARLSLNRPEQRNALSREMLDALQQALDRVDRAEGVRAVVLEGRGPAFSAGHDLREMSTAAPAEIEDLFRRCEGVMTTLHRVRVPVVARVHGIATAAGCQLVAACDLAVAAEEASFATPGIKVGLFCSTPAVPLVRSVGRKRALEMLLSGRSIDAATALDWGLVNRVVPRDDLDRAIDELLAPVLESSAEVVASGKQVFWRQVDLPEAEAWAPASRAMCEGVATPSAREGFSAFLEKRKPRWPGA
ncbi:MAG: enoyl-CoA hydratase [Alphaproteobacteria bacterium]